MTDFFLYALPFICIGTFIYTNWYVGEDLDVGTFATMALVSVIPFLNGIVLIATLLQFFDRVCVLDGVLIKGRKRDMEN